MIWEISNADQALTVLFSFLTGITLSVIYDFFKAPRICGKHSAFRIFFEDLLFGAIAALITFCLLILRTKGQMRIYVFVFMALGFIVWRITLSRFLVKIIAAVLRLFSRTFKKLNAFFDKCGQKTEKLFKKVSKILKKGLKGIKRMLYNHLRKYKSAKPNDIRQDDSLNEREKA